MLDPHLSALLWMGVLATLIIVIIMPQPLGIRALVIVSILRLIFSVGLEPTLYFLGGVNVSPTTLHCPRVSPDSPARTIHRWVGTRVIWSAVGQSLCAAEI